MSRRRANTELEGPVSEGAKVGFSDLAWLCTFLVSMDTDAGRDPSISMAAGMDMDGDPIAGNFEDLAPDERGGINILWNHILSFYRAGRPESASSYPGSSTRVLLNRLTASGSRKYLALMLEGGAVIQRLKVTREIAYYLHHDITYYFDIFHMKFNPLDLRLRTTLHEFMVLVQTAQEFELKFKSTEYDDVKRLFLIHLVVIRAFMMLDVVCESWNSKAESASGAVDESSESAQAAALLASYLKFTTACLFYRQYRVDEWKQTIRGSFVGSRCGQGLGSLLSMEELVKASLPAGLPECLKAKENSTAVLGDRLRAFERIVLDMGVASAAEKRAAAAPVTSRSIKSREGRALHKSTSIGPGFRGLIPQCLGESGESVDHDGPLFLDFDQTLIKLQTFPTAWHMDICAAATHVSRLQIEDFNKDLVRVLRNHQGAVVIVTDHCNNLFVSAVVARLIGLINRKSYNTEQLKAFVMTREPSLPISASSSIITTRMRSKELTLPMQQPTSYGHAGIHVSTFAQIKTAQRVAGGDSRPHMARGSLMAYTRQTEKWPKWRRIAEMLNDNRLGFTANKYQYSPTFVDDNPANCLGVASAQARGVYRNRQWPKLKILKCDPSIGKLTTYSPDSGALGSHADADGGGGGDALPAARVESAGAGAGSSCFGDHDARLYQRHIPRDLKEDASLRNEDEQGGLTDAGSDGEGPSSTSRAA